jgi:hypothetical protein
VAVGEGLLTGSRSVVGDDRCSCRFGKAAVQCPGSACARASGCRVGVRILVGLRCQAGELTCVLLELGGAGSSRPRPAPLNRTFRTRKIFVLKILLFLPCAASRARPAHYSLRITRRCPDPLRRRRVPELGEHVRVLALRVSADRSNDKRQGIPVSWLHCVE